MAHQPAYQPIEDYGIIGNMHTVALVGKNGSIDWYCHPDFDSPSVFGAILDDGKGGRYKISPKISENILQIHTSGHFQVIDPRRLPNSYNN